MNETNELHPLRRKNTCLERVVQAAGVMKTYIRLAIATNSLSGLEQVLDLRERGLEEMGR
jgi:hypothetical protein